MIILKFYHCNELFGICQMKMILLSQNIFQIFTCAFSLYKRPSCQTWSDALDNSRKTLLHSNDRFASDALQTLWTIKTSWCTHESPGLNPDWLPLRRLLLFNPSRPNPGRRKIKKNSHFFVVTQKVLWRP